MLDKLFRSDKAREYLKEEIKKLGMQAALKQVAVEALYLNIHSGSVNAREIQKLLEVLSPKLKCYYVSASSFSEISDYAGRWSIEFVFYA